jgi:hypothetical protein
MADRRPTWTSTLSLPTRALWPLSLPGARASPPPIKSPALAYLESIYSGLSSRLCGSRQFPTGPYGRQRQRDRMCQARGLAGVCSSRRVRSSGPPGVGVRIATAAEASRCSTSPRTRSGGIAHIAACSPHARGRSERVFGTLRDRLADRAGAVVLRRRLSRHGTGMTRTDHELPIPDRLSSSRQPGQAEAGICAAFNP